MSAKSARNDSIGEDAAYVGGLVKRVGNFDPERFLDDLQERKKFQKTVYLMQAFGIQVGYEFRWYVHGPYSSALADVGYEIARNYNGISELNFSEKEATETFEQYLAYIEDMKDNFEKLEISASLHFLWERNQDMQRDILIQWLQKEKDLESDFNEIEQIWFELEEEGVIGK